MRRYLGVKIVEAKPMTRGEYTGARGWLIPTDENPADAGYLVTYPDGYVSWCPKKQFEEANRELDGMTFGHALEAARLGALIRRKAWSGDYLLSFDGAIVPRTSADPELLALKASLLETFGESGVARSPCLVNKAEDGEITPWIWWLGNLSDFLADDWMIAG